MAIAFDNTFNGNISGVTSMTISHTVTSNTNGILAVGVGLDDATPKTVSSITAIKGGSATNLTNIRTDGTSNTERTELWYILLPDTGTHNVVISFSGTTAGAVAGTVSLTGVDQSNPIDANNGATGNSGTASVSITTIANNAWIMDTVMGATSNVITMTAHTNRTQRWNVAQSTDNVVGAGSTLGPATPAGSFTMDWTFGAQLWAESAASFKPFVAASSIFDDDSLIPTLMPLTDPSVSIWR